MRFARAIRTRELPMNLPMKKSALVSRVRRLALRLSRRYQFRSALVQQARLRRLMLRFVEHLLGLSQQVQAVLDRKNRTAEQAEHHADDKFDHPNSSLLARTSPRPVCSISRREWRRCR